jgi:hypothetical protein
MTTETKPRFTNIAEIRQANKNAGRFWFSPETVRAFASRVESRVYDGGAGYDYPDGSRLWVESTKNYDDTAREYKIALFSVFTGDISYLNARAAKYTILRFRTKTAAVQCIEGLL